MTPQHIKDNAPEEATHTIESYGSTDYLKWDGKNWYLYYEYHNAPPEWQYTNMSVIGEFRHTIKPL